MADVGCGLGASAILMAQAFPNSRFFGYDSHPKSIERAAEAGVGDRVSFEVASATEFPGREYESRRPRGIQDARMINLPRQMAQWSKTCQLGKVGIAASLFRAR